MRIARSFEDAMAATVRLRTTYENLSQRLQDESLESGESVEQWQQRAQPEFAEVQAAIAAYHEAGLRLVEAWKTQNQAAS